TTAVLPMSRPSKACRTWTTIGRPQMTCSGLGRSDRMRVPWPAARTIARALTTSYLAPSGHRSRARRDLGGGEQPRQTDRTAPAVVIGLLCAAEGRVTLRAGRAFIGEA